MLSAGEVALRAERSETLASSRDRLREAAKALFAKRGYESTSTLAICRLAGTSESQLMKHFDGKLGVLEAIFEHGWEHINPAIRLATESIPAPEDKLRTLMEMVINFLQSDRELCTLFLLEGRRIRDGGRFVVFVPGFLEFVRIVDGILQQLADQGRLAPGVHPQAMRSAIMGAIEGLLRDQMLAGTSGFPANYSESDLRATTLCFLRACLATSAAGSQ